MLFKAPRRRTRWGGDGKNGWGHNEASLPPPSLPLKPLNLHANTQVREILTTGELRRNKALADNPRFKAVRDFMR